MGGSSPTTTVSNKLPAWATAYGSAASKAALPAFQAGVSRVQNATPETYVRGGPAQVAGLTPEHQQAFDMTRSLAGEQAGQFAGGTDYLTQAAGGGFLDSNPFVDDIVANARQNTLEAINRSMSGSGRYGSPVHSEMLGRGITEATLPVLSQNYEAERLRQMQAIQQLPIWQQAQYLPSQKLGATGDILQGQQQRELDAALNYQRLLGGAQQNIDQNLLAAGTINPASMAPSSTVTTQNPGSPSLFSTLLGVGTTLGGAYLGGPGGAVVGNYLGGLF